MKLLRHKEIYAILYRIMIGRHPKYIMGMISKNPNKLQRIIDYEDEKHIDTEMVQAVGIMQQRYYFNLRHAVNDLKKSVINSSEQFV